MSDFKPDFKQVFVPDCLRDFQVQIDWDLIRNFHGDR